MSLYRVLKAGIRQRSSEGGWSTPKVGDVIKVSETAAPVLMDQGWIEMYSGGSRPAPETTPVERAPEPPRESRRERKRRLAAALGLGGGDAQPAEEPPVDTNEGGDDVN